MLLVAGFLARAVFATGVILIVSDLRRPREPRRSLTQRLLPHQPQLGDEVEEWLRRRSP